MTRPTAKPERAGRAPEDETRTRNCLRCKAEFRSGWSGERICPRCKSSRTWRNSAISAPPASSGSRR